VIRVATANILKTLDRRPARRALLSVLAHRPAFGGLQEWEADRDAILRELGYLTRTPYARKLPSEDYVFLRPLHGGPVAFYDAARYDLARLRSRLLAHGPRPTRATELILQDKRSGALVPVLDLHLLAHHDRPAYEAAWRAGRGAAMDWAEQWHGGPAFVLGDTNKHRMDLPPLRSCWDGRAAQPTGPGGGTIDSIYARERALEVETIAHDGDHKAVVATYRKEN
jgi:hypothetical protein